MFSIPDPHSANRPTVLFITISCHIIPPHPDNNGLLMRIITNYPCRYSLRAISLLLIIINIFNMQPFSTFKIKLIPKVVLYSCLVNVCRIKCFVFLQCVLQICLFVQFIIVYSCIYLCLAFCLA